MSYLGDGETDAVLLRDGRTLRFGNTTVRVVADAEVTRGTYSAYAIDVAPGPGGAQPHFHRAFTESFHVVAGTPELYDGTGWAPAAAGDHLVIPPGSVHGYRNRGDAPVHLLMLSVPGVAREDYFAELAAVISEGRPLTAEAWTDLYARHDQVMVPER